MNAVSHKQYAKTPKIPGVRPGNVHKHLQTVEDTSIHSAAKTNKIPRHRHLCTAVNSMLYSFIDVELTVRRILTLSLLSVTFSL